MGRIKVLLVDDNEDYCSIVRDYLDMQDDMEVVGAAADGLVAMEMIRARKPDVVLLDLIIPFLDGIGVLKKINLLGSGERPRVIVVSATAHDKITQSVISLGADYFMIKSTAIEMLIDRIRMVVSPLEQNPQHEGINKLGNVVSFYR